jgi:hypothetical protein
MSEAILVQGRRLEPEDCARIRELIAGNPDWSRRRLSEVLATEWDWRNASGQLKDMAARTLLLKLEAQGLIQLPARRQIPTNRMRRPRIVREVWDQTPVRGALGNLGPLTVREVSREASDRARFAAALDQFHYLGYGGTVGENLQYTVTDATGRLLACLLFGSAAWKCRTRDEFIGWTAEQRTRQLHLVTNNHRFLILPFVEVGCLASHLLGCVARRLSDDWQQKYGHPILLVETFVERQRFRGTCYRAANWLRVGETTGRSRQDRYTKLRVPVKDVYLYPLRRRFRRELGV